MARRTRFIWSDKNIIEMLKIIALEHFGNGKSMTEAFEIVAKQLKCPKDSVQSKYYNLFVSADIDSKRRKQLMTSVLEGELSPEDLLALLRKDEDDKQLTDIEAAQEPAPKGKIAWTEDEEAVLIQCVYNALISGETRQQAFQEAARRLMNRSEAACAGKYHNMVTKDILEEAGMSEVEYLEDWLEQSGSAAAANSVRQQGISGQQSTPGTDLAQRTPAMKIVRRGKKQLMKQEHNENVSNATITTTTTAVAEADQDPVAISTAALLNHVVNRMDRIERAMDRMERALERLSSQLDRLESRGDGNLTHTLPLLGGLLRLQG